MKQAQSIQECVDRLNALTGKDYEHLHAEADMLLCDALLVAKASPVVDAWLDARTRLKFQYA